MPKDDSLIDPQPAATGAEEAPGAATPESDSVDLLGGHLQSDTSVGVKYNKDGSIRKKPGRKPGQIYGEKTPVENSTPKTRQEKALQKISSEQTARMLVNSATAILATMIGEEWQFNDQAEADGMREVVAAYLDAKGGAEFTPEMALMFAIGGYALPRAGHENTRSKIGGFFRKVFGFFRK